MRFSEKLFLVGIVAATGFLGCIGNQASKLALAAQVEQTAYLCNNGHEASCHKLALWTDKQCASPRFLGGCRYDSNQYKDEALGVLVSDRPAGRSRSRLIGRTQQ